MAYYQHTVKYLCGDGDDVILVKGVYRTAINIHNPYDFWQRPVCFKVLSPTPDGAPTPPGPWQRAELGPDWGMEINCRRITDLSRGIPTGFVVIRSPNEMDVVAVYTVERSDQPVMSLRSRRLPRESFRPTKRCVATNRHRHNPRRQIRDAGARRARNRSGFPPARRGHRR